MHCYVKREEYKIKKEQKWIDEDIKKIKLAYRKEQYRISGGLHPESEYQTYSAEEFARMDKEGKNLSGSFTNIEDAIKHLNSK